MSATTANGLATIEINGRSFVAGLVWKPLQSGRKYMAEAKAYGRANSMEMVTIRKGRAGVLQAGYAPKGLARGATLYSLAASLGGQLGDNWVGVFPIDREADQYALIAVFKGSVVAGRGDMVGGFNDIQATLRETYSLLSSDSSIDFEADGRVIAPETFEFGAESLELIDLLKPKNLRNDYRLRPLTFGLTRRQLVMVAGGVAATIVAVAGYNWWDGAREEAIARRQELVELARQKLAQTQPKTEVPKPWKTAPAAFQVLESCASHLAATPLALGGWIFDRAECTAEQAVTSYTRMDGTPASAFVTAAVKSAGATPGLHNAGTTGTIISRTTLQAAPKEQLQPTAEILLALTSRIQSVDDDSTFSLTEIPFDADPEDPQAGVPDWTTTGFVLQTPFPPLELFAGMDLSGVRVFEVFTNLNHEQAVLAWTVTGEIYGR